jgi:hypothetical protein
MGSEASLVTCIADIYGKGIQQRFVRFRGLGRLPASSGQDSLHERGRRLPPSPQRHNSRSIDGERNIAPEEQRGNLANSDTDTGSEILSLCNVCH